MISDVEKGKLIRLDSTGENIYANNERGYFRGVREKSDVDAKKAYVRGAIDPNTTATKARKRYPFVETIEPHNPRKN